MSAMESRLQDRLTWLSFMSVWRRPNNTLPKSYGRGKIQMPAKEEQSSAPLAYVCRAQAHTAAATALTMPFMTSGLGLGLAWSQSWPGPKPSFGPCQAWDESWFEPRLWSESHFGLVQLCSESRFEVESKHRLAVVDKIIAGLGV